MSPIALIFLSTVAAQTNSAAPPKPAMTPPAAVGTPHSCADYPVAAMQTKSEGTTTVGFTITETGSVTDVAVKTSSGNADLDNASVACTKTWQYRPATTVADGKPVATPWKVAVKWVIHPAPPFDAIDDTAYKCVQLTDAGRDELSHAKLQTVVRVHFVKGDIAGVSVAGSSGDSNLDRHVAECYGRIAPALTASLQDDSYQLLMPLQAQ